MKLGALRYASAKAGGVGWAGCGETVACELACWRRRRRQHLVSYGKTATARWRLVAVGWP